MMTTSTRSTRSSVAATNTSQHTPTNAATGVSREVKAFTTLKTPRRSPHASCPGCGVHDRRFCPYVGSDRQVARDWLDHSGDVHGELALEAEVQGRVGVLVHACTTSTPQGWLRAPSSGAAYSARVVAAQGMPCQGATSTHLNPASRQTSIPRSSPGRSPTAAAGTGLGFRSSTCRCCTCDHCSTRSRTRRRCSSRSCTWRHGGTRNARRQQQRERQVSLLLLLLPPSHSPTEIKKTQLNALQPQAMPGHARQ